MYSSMLYAKNPVFEIFHEGEREGLSSTHIQQEYSAEPSVRRTCVTKEFPISPRFSVAFFHRDAI